MLVCTEICSCFTASTIYDWGYLTHHITCTECEWAVTVNRSVRLLVSRYYQCCSKPFRLFNLTWFTTHENCSQGMLGQPGTAFQIGQVDMYAAMASRESMQTDMEVEQACTEAFKNKVHLANVEIKNIKCMIQNMAEAVKLCKT